MRPLLLLLLLLRTLIFVVLVSAYFHAPCSREVRHQLGHWHCYVPPMDDNLLLTKASFLMSHDAATGYMSMHHVFASYGKNQRGTITQQLSSGARAFDLRPMLLYNSTIIFQHESIIIPVTFQQILQETISWCSKNRDELVLLLPSHVAYQNTSLNKYNYASAVSKIAKEFGVAYLSCHEVDGWTVGDAKKAGALVTGGSLLIMDDYGSFCGKSNWIESQLVTCYSYVQEDGSRNTHVRCTNPNTPQPLQALHEYLVASANTSRATDNANELGPPYSTYNTPFNEIQGIWQVTASSAIAGLTHMSTLLADNRQSQLQANLVQWIYNGDLQQISLLAVDDVQLYGLALYAVLRHQCGQTTDNERCGSDWSIPKLQKFLWQRIVGWTALGLLMSILLCNLLLRWKRKNSDHGMDFVYNEFTAQPLS